MEIEEFRKNGYKLIDWIADYYSDIEKFPVKSQVNPREIITRYLVKHLLSQKISIRF